VTIALATASVARVAITNEKHARKIHQARDQSSVGLTRPALPEVRLAACCVESGNDCHTEAGSFQSDNRWSST